ncbi:MAG: hypothetical protein JWP01_2834 [Myxococcales bacterium]|nr:hypothetical protein [Myxococcales bacterium]
MTLGVIAALEREGSRWGRRLRTRLAHHARALHLDPLMADDLVRRWDAGTT